MRILNKEQAAAIYQAMMALNNINARLDVYVDDIIVEETFHGAIIVARRRPYISYEPYEHYKSQAVFAEAYNL